MTDQPFRLLRLDLAVLYLDPYGLPTIEAHRIDSYRLPRKEPADRQRFKRSLAEPFLHAVYSQSVMRREIVEGGKGNDVVGLRVEPTRETEGRE
jgi:hypothetical protein